MNKDLHDQQLHSALRNFSKVERELRVVNYRIIDYKKFDKTAEEYAKATEQLVKSLDRVLSVNRNTPLILTSNPYKTFNRPYVIGITILVIVLGVVVTIAQAL